MSRVRIGISIVIPAVLLCALAAPGGAAVPSEEMRALLADRANAEFAQRADDLVNLSNADDAIAVIAVIAKEKAVEAAPALAHALSHFDPRVGLLAAQSLDSLIVDRPAAQITVAFRPLLASRNDALRLIAVRMAGLGRDDTAIGRLVEILEEHASASAPAPAAGAPAGSSESTAAHDALALIVGVDLGPTPKPWRQWYNLQEARFKEEFPKYAADLKSGDRLRIADAAVALGTLKVHQAEIAEALAPLAESKDELISARVQDTLGMVHDAPPAALAEPGGDEAPAAPAKRPTAAPAKVAAPAEAPPVSQAGYTIAVIVALVALVGGLAWWIRRLTAGSRMPSVAEVVARSQREAGIDSERSVPAVRAPARAAPVVTGVKPDIAARIVAAKAAGKKADGDVGKRGEKIFKLD